MLYNIFDTFWTCYTCGIMLNSLVYLEIQYVTWPWLLCSIPCFDLVGRSLPLLCFWCSCKHTVSLALIYSASASAQVAQHLQVWNFVPLPVNSLFWVTAVAYRKILDIEASPILRWYGSLDKFELSILPKVLILWPGSSLMWAAVPVPHCCYLCFLQYKEG